MEFQQKVLQAYEKIEELIESLEFSYDDEGGPSKIRSEDFLIEFSENDQNNLEAKLTIFNDDDHGEHEELRFEIFEKLEKLVWIMYQDFQNNDPCSFMYVFDTDHLNDDLVIYRVVGIDYLS